MTNVLTLASRSCSEYQREYWVVAKECTGLTEIKALNIY